MPGWTENGVKRNAVQDFSSVRVHPSSWPYRCWRIAFLSGLTTSWLENLNSGEKSIKSIPSTYRVILFWIWFCSMRHWLRPVADRNVTLAIVTCSASKRSRKTVDCKFEHAKKRKFTLFSTFSLILHFCVYIFIWVYNFSNMIYTFYFVFCFSCVCNAGRKRLTPSKILVSIYTRKANLILLVSLQFNI